MKTRMGLSKIFKEYKEGETIALIGEGFPQAWRGRTGIILGKQGQAYIVKIKFGGMEKKLVLMGTNFKKLKSS